MLIHLENLTGALLRTTNDPLALGEFSDFYIAKHNVQGF